MAEITNNFGIIIIFAATFRIFYHQTPKMVMNE